MNKARERERRASLQSLLERREFLLCDGALGSELIARGLGGGEAPESWNVAFPERVAAVHRAYREAGCRLIQANTFGANRIKLSRAGLSERLEEFNRAAVELALEEASAAGFVSGDVGPTGGRRPGTPALYTRFVSGDVGPTGELLQPLGPLSLGEAEEAYAEQMTLLQAAGVHCLSVETMYDLREAQAALGAAKQVCQLPVLVSLNFRQTPKGFFTIMGDPLVRSLETLLDEGAAAVGANCELVSAQMVELARTLRQEGSPPLQKACLFLQPNAGAPLLREGIPTYELDEERFVEDMRTLRQLDISLLGGCCGTTPALMKEVAQALDPSRL